MNKPNIIGLRAAIRNAFEIISKNENLGFIAKTTIVFGAISTSVIVPAYLLMVGLSMSSTTKYYSATGNELLNPTTPTVPVALIIGFSVFMLALIFWSMYATSLIILLPIKVHNGEIQDVKALLKEALNKAVKLQVLYFFIMLIVFLGSILLIIPGIIFGIMYMYSPFIMLNENTGVFEAMKRSKALVAGYKWNLFSKGFRFALLGILAVVPVFALQYMLSSFAMVLLNAFSILVLLQVYKSLKEAKNPVTTISQAPEVATVAPQS